MAEAPQDDDDPWRRLQPKRQHVVCATDEALISVDLDGYQRSVTVHPGTTRIHHGERRCSHSIHGEGCKYRGRALGKNAPQRLTRVPEKLSSIAVTPDGLWLCGGGAASGRLYLWELWSGRRGGGRATSAASPP